MSGERPYRDVTPPHHHTISRLEEIANKTSNRQNYQGTKDTHPKAKRSYLQGTWKRVLPQGHLHRTVKRSRQIYQGSRSSWRVQETRTNIRPSWVEKITSFETMGPRNHPKTRCTRHHRLQTISITAQRWRSPSKVAQWRREQGLYKTLYITNRLIILLPSKSWRVTKTSTRLQRRQQMDSSQPISTPSHTRADRGSTRRIRLHQVRRRRRL